MTSGWVRRRGRRALGVSVSGALACMLCVITVTAHAASIAASTGHVHAVSASTAQVTGAVEGSGTARYVFEFGPTPRLGGRTPPVTVHAQGSGVRVVARLTGLRPATRYYFRLTVAACAGCRAVVGRDESFTTREPTPVVEAVAASGIGQTTAALSGAIDPEGVPTSYRFQYGRTKHYGALTGSRSAGDSRRRLRATVAVTRLAPATTYHYRIVATSRAGTSFGPDETLTTNGFYTNPVYRESMPDPYVLDVNHAHDDYWAFGTGKDFPVLHSTNLVDWSPEPTAFTAPPVWVTHAADWHPWAPSVIQSAQSCPHTRSQGCFVMFYVGISGQYNVDCIGVATSTTPGGPYTDQGPLVTTPNLGTLLGTILRATPGLPIGCGDSTARENIDPSPFVSPSGQAYLYVSTDSACSLSLTGGHCTFAPTISVIPLAADLLTASGPRTPLFSGQAGTWEDLGTGAPTVEGPSMEFHDGTYYLFYSGGSYISHYAMGYATSSSPSGPFVKSPANPIFRATTKAISPGGGDDFVTGPHGGEWMIYAARLGSVKAARTLWIDPVSWDPSSTPGAPETPLIAGPTTTAQGLQP